MAVGKMKKMRPYSPGQGRLLIHKYYWPLTGVLIVAVVGIIAYLSMSTHDHISGGRFVGFVGPGKCKQCHRKQYDSWQKTRMANSFDVLKPGVKAEEKRMAGLDPVKDYTGEETCLSCHTTGYGLAGGFVSIEKTPEMAGVTCESCHGYGGTYVNSVMDPKKPMFSTAAARESGLVYPPREKVCRSCHNERSPFFGMHYKFDYEERVKLGTHQHFQLKYEHGK